MGGLKMCVGNQSQLFVVEHIFDCLLFLLFLLVFLCLLFALCLGRLFLCQSFLFRGAFGVALLTISNSLKAGGLIRLDCRRLTGQALSFLALEPRNQIDSRLDLWLVYNATTKLLLRSAIRRTQLHVRAVCCYRFCEEARTFCLGRVTHSNTRRFCTTKSVCCLIQRICLCITTARAFNRKPSTSRSYYCYLELTDSSEASGSFFQAMIAALSMREVTSWQ